MRTRRLLVIATSALALTLVAWPCAGVNAQSDDPGVAFVSTLNGDVSVQRGDSGDVVAAGINAPLMVGDYVSTAPNARAEVQFDYGHVVRVGPNSQIRFTELGSRDDTVQLASGSVGVGVLHATSQYTQVETPSVIVRPREAGSYRVSIDPNGVTAITVRSGNAAVLLPHGMRWLDPGSTMLVWGPANNPSFRYIHTRDRDSFDQWNNDRNAAFEHANAYQYASSTIPGLYTLGGYGQWQNDADYGNEWIPNESSNWSPYASGRWVSEPYYGWTWVDNSNWGYAPFHYGRWHRDRHRNRWAWTPGPRAQPAPSWSPALVAFIGYGGGSSIDNIGWVPLAPNEQPHPWWGSASRSYAAASVPNMQRTYVNSQYPNAVHGMPRQSFANGESQHIAPVGARNFQHAVVMRNALPVVPGPQALRYTQRAPAATHAPSAQAFHAFTSAPRAPQTFTQQRAQATAATQHLPLTAAPPRPAAAAPPQRPRPVVQQPRPAAPAPGRPAPVVQQARPGVPAPARPAPVVQHARPAVPAPARPAPVVQHARPGAPAPVRPAPVVQARPAAPVRPAPVVQQARPAVAAPVRPAPVVQARPAAPVRPAPVVQQARPVAPAPVRPAPVVQQARPVAPAPVRPAPVVQQARPVAPAPVRAAPVVQQPRAPVAAPVRAAPVVQQPRAPVAAPVRAAPVVQPVRAPVPVKPAPVVHPAVTPEPAH